MFAFNDILTNLSKFTTSLVEQLLLFIPLVSEILQLFCYEFDLLKLFELDFYGLELRFGHLLEKLKIFLICLFLVILIIAYLELFLLLGVLFVELLQFLEG